MTNETAHRTAARDRATWQAGRVLGDDDQVHNISGEDIACGYLGEHVSTDLPVDCPACAAIEQQEV